PSPRPPQVIRGPTRRGRAAGRRSCNSSRWPRDLLRHHRGCSVRIPVTRPYGCHESLVRSSFSSRDWLSNPTLVLKQDPLQEIRLLTCGLLLIFLQRRALRDRKSTRLNSSHVA